ncbi:MAG: hypothetical protein ACO32I_01265 [Candidatus Limnocylindrus sp.]
MDPNQVMYAAFAEELVKIAADLSRAKVVGLLGLGAVGTVGASSLGKRWNAANKELEEQSIENMQKRLSRMQALHASKYEM